MFKVSDLTNIQKQHSHYPSIHLFKRRRDLMLFAFMVSCSPKYVPRHILPFLHLLHSTANFLHFNYYLYWNYVRHLLIHSQSSIQYYARDLNPANKNNQPMCHIRKSAAISYRNFHDTTSLHMYDILFHYWRRERGKCIII